MTRLDCEAEVKEQRNGGDSDSLPFRALKEKRHVITSAAPLPPFPFHEAAPFGSRGFFVNANLRVPCVLHGRHSYGHNV